MTYELALRLKNAGFPQEVEESTLERGDFVVDDPNVPEEKWEHFIDPTLEELIEACGPRFKSLRAMDRGGWYAEDFDNNLGTSYNSPNEAVANLWLTKNKHEGN